MRRYSYLVCVDAIGNHNKFYEIRENDDFSLDVHYGRVGEAGQNHHYQQWERNYDTLYREKTRKGYQEVDTPKRVLISRPQTSQQNPAITAYPSEQKAMDFAGKLLSRCRTIVDSSYRHYEGVSQSAIETARRLIQQLKNNSTGTLRQFNLILMNLYSVIPRRMCNVMDYCAKSSSDFDRIIVNEEQLLDKLQAVVNSKSDVTQPANKPSVTFTPITYKEEAEIKAIMKDRAGAFSSAVRVDNPTETAEFELCKGKLLKNDIRLLFHGSDVGNWWSIAHIGLKLNGSHYGA